MLGKVPSIVLIVILFVVAFLVVNTLHFLFFPVRVVLYDSLLDAAFAGIMATICIVFLRGRFATTREEMALSLIIALLLSTLYALCIPTIIDRSLSVYLLEKLVQRGGSIRQDAFEDILKREWMAETQLVDARLTEALKSSTVTVENGCVRLTPRGRMIADFTRFYRTHLLPKKREIMGRLSDDLTDPFRKSYAIVPFKCE